RPTLSTWPAGTPTRTRPPYTTLFRSFTGANNTMILEGRTLGLAAGTTSTWSGGSLQLQSGAVLSIPSGATLNNTADTFAFTNGGSYAFTTDVTSRRSAGTGTTTVQLP